MYISEICTRARPQASILYRKFYGHISSSTLLQLYLTFVQPHIEHAAPVWYPHQQSLSDSLLKRVQKFALKMCMRDWNDYATLLQSSNLPTLASRRCAKCRSNYYEYGCRLQAGTGYRGFLLYYLWFRPSRWTLHYRAPARQEVQEKGGWGCTGFFLELPLHLNRVASCITLSCILDTCTCTVG